MRNKINLFFFWLKQVGEWKKAIFISILYSSSLIFLLALSTDFSLHTFEEREIGEGILRNIDISIRVNLFYRCIGFFIIFNIFFLKLFHYLKNNFDDFELEVLNYSSFSGLALLFFCLYNDSLLINLRSIGNISDLLRLFSSFALLGCIHIAIYTSILYKRMMGVKTNFFSSYHFITVLLISFSVYFLFRQFSLFFNNLLLIDISIFTLVLSGIILLVLSYYHKKTTIAQNNFSANWPGILKSFMFIPALTVFSDEFYLILNNYRIYALSPWHIYLILFLLLALLAVRNYLERKKQDTTLKSTLFNYYFPVLIFNISLITYYAHTANINHDMFEIANPALSIQQFYSYGKIPFLETFNSHLLSEYFWGFLYTIINGFDISEPFNFTLYNFMDTVLTTVIIYFFLRKYTGNGYVSLFYLLFVPFLSVLFPKYYSIVLLSVFVFDRLAQNQSLKNYLLWIIFILFFLIWRIDIGFANLIASVILLFIILKAGIHYLNLLKAIVIILSMIIAFMVTITLTNSINFFYVLNDILQHLSSAQAYGYKALSSDYDTLFLIQHFIFPLIVVSLLCYLSVNRSKFYFDPEKRFVLISILFLSLFYLANFQRGLVRHGFVENTDIMLSSFVFFILSGSVYLFYFQKHTHLFKFILFLTAGNILVYSYKYPKNETGKLSSNYDKFVAKLSVFPPLEPTNSRIVRSSQSESFKEDKYKNLDKFLKSYLKSDETFLDFSNSPMLYFYTNRATPSFFNQFPIMAHNDYLQDKCLSTIKKEKIPVVIFSHVPANWYDNPDEVPNSVRHYKLAEYIFKNYSPYLILDNKAIWISNNCDRVIQEKNTLHWQADNYSTLPVSYNLLYLPYIWGTYDNKINTITDFLLLDKQNKSSDKENKNIYWLTDNINKYKECYLSFAVQTLSNSPIECKVSYGKDNQSNGEFLFIVPSSPKTEKKIAIRLSTQYNWWVKEKEWIRIERTGHNTQNDNILFKEIKILKGD